MPLSSSSLYRGGGNGGGGSSICDPGMGIGSLEWVEVLDVWELERDVKGRLSRAGPRVGMRTAEAEGRWISMLSVKAEGRPSPARFAPGYQDVDYELLHPMHLPHASNLSITFHLDRCLLESP